MIATCVNQFIKIVTCVKNMLQLSFIMIYKDFEKNYYYIFIENKIIITYFWTLEKENYYKI